MSLRNRWCLAKLTTYRWLVNIVFITMRTVLFSILMLFECFIVTLQYTKFLACVKTYLTIIIVLIINF